jgi:hypothetical protein
MTLLFAFAAAFLASIAHWYFNHDTAISCIEGVAVFYGLVLAYYFDRWWSLPISMSLGAFTTLIICSGIERDCGIKFVFFFLPSLLTSFVLVTVINMFYKRPARI